MPKTEETILEIDLNSLAHNYKYLRSKLSENTRFMGVVKAFAYGSDSVRIAQKLVDLGVDYLSVAYIKEGVALRRGGIEKPILVFHPQRVNFKILIDFELTPTIYSKNSLNNFIEIATQEGKKDYPIHLNINTGMNRLGFEESEIDFILEKMRSTDSISIEGIYSHLVASEDENEREFTLRQYEKYKEVSGKFLKKLDYKPIRHLCNTSGILNYPQAHFEMVRAGIGLYGYGNSAEENKNLKPMGTLKTLISQIHDVAQGESVGYNRKFIAQKPSKIATLPLGYADGFQRKYGLSKTTVAVNGCLTPVIGDVCMDMIMIDITGVECQEGDEVIVFGKDKSADDFAVQAETISYEIITTISQRVKREIIE